MLKGINNLYQILYNKCLEKKLIIKKVYFLIYIDFNILFKDINENLR